MDAIEVLKHSKFTDADLEGFEIIPDPIISGCSAVILPTVRMACIVYHDSHDLAPDFETCDDYQVALDRLAKHRVK